MMRGKLLGGLEFWGVLGALTFLGVGRGLWAADRVGLLRRLPSDFWSWRRQPKLASLKQGLPSSANPAKSSAPQTSGHSHPPSTRKVRAQSPPKKTQDNPVICPASFTSIPFAAGTAGSPGIVMISPHTITTKPAPADSLTSRIVST